ncbi:MAG: NAD(P)-dependent oxidoreductase [Candidatus Saccharimonas sp.]
MKVLVTGGSGRLGRAILPALADHKHEILLASRRPVEVTENVKTIIVDFKNDDELESVFIKEKPDAVLHMASVVGRDCDMDSKNAYEINVDLTKRLGELASEYSVRSFIFISTAAVYSQETLSPTDEYSNIMPLSIYGKTKLEAENEIEMISHESNTNYISLRVFNIYGPNFDQSLINRLAISTEDTPVSLVGYDRFYRDYIHVADVAQSIVRCLDLTRVKLGYSVYNIASGKAVTNKQVIDSLRSQGVEPHYTIRGDEVSYSWADISNATNDLDFSPKDTITIE